MSYAKHKPRPAGILFLAFSLLILWAACTHRDQLAALELPLHECETVATPHPHEGCPLCDELWEIR